MEQRGVQAMKAKSTRISFQLSFAPKDSSVFLLISVLFLFLQPLVANSGSTFFNKLSQFVVSTETSN